MTIAVVANSAWYLFNFRRRLMHALQAQGHQVLAIAPADDYATRLVADGIPWLDWPLAASGTRPWVELRSVLALRRLLARQAVHAAFTYTPKANIYCGLAARGLTLAQVPNVSGLGRAFIDPSLLTHVVVRLYRLALGRAHRVVFQNEDDRKVFLRAGLVDAARTLRVPGSGVDLDHFQPAAWPADAAEAPVFLFVGRVLRDKGVREFAEAAALLRTRGSGARFRILGSVQAHNPTAIPAAEWQFWSDQGLIEMLGSTDDVRPHLAQASCIVLPSYREGVPRALLEGAAMARPCIATDVPGCRDAVLDGRTGLLCAARDGDALAHTLQRFLDAGVDVWQRMGDAGRAYVEEKFDEQRVIASYLQLARDLDVKA
jgi:glycosyltransferase involved in cell wall biosynthesis